MKEKELSAKLIAAARNNPPGEHVPYAFEKRIMSALSEQPAPNVWALWGEPLWRAALSCVAITALCGVWSLTAHRTPEAMESFSPDFEAVVIAPPSQQIGDSW